MSEPILLTFRPAGPRTKIRQHVVSDEVDVRLVVDRDLEGRTSSIVVKITTDGLLAIGKINPVGTATRSIMLDALWALLAPEAR